MPTKKSTLRNTSDASGTGKILSPGTPELAQPIGYGRLSDPGNKDILRATLKSLSSDKEHALRFLQSIGIANADGQLSKRYGG